MVPELDGLTVPYLLTSARRLYVKVTLPIKSHDSFIMWCCGMTWQTTNIISPLTNLEGLQTIKSFNILIMSSCKINVINEHHYITTTKMLMAAKLGRMITYLDGLLPTMSHDPLIMHSCEITWQIKTVISQLLQCLWPPAWQGADLPLGVPNRYSHLTFNLVVLLSWLTKNISITSILMGTKLYNQTHQNDAILVKDVVLFF